MTLIASIDEAACAAHGDCAIVAPDVFRIDDVAVVVGSGPDDLLLEAAQSCPSVAIVVTDAASGEQVYP
jgi:ferredoxin